MAKRKLSFWTPFGGVAEMQQYRHGEKRPVYAPGKAPIVKAVLGGDKRQQALVDTRRILENWRSSPFEFEGPAVAGVRSGLCLDGTPWAVSDIVAHDLVAETLRDMGARRPTWEEGQPGAVDELVRCLWCSRELPPENTLGHRKMRYCDEVCAKSAFEHKAFERRSGADRAYAQARAIVQRSKRPPRECAECGKEFRPSSEYRDQKSCSESCAAKQRMKRIRAEMRIHTCSYCGDKFHAANGQGKFCTRRCEQLMRRKAKGMVPKKLTYYLFDHYFTVPNNASRPVWLTPERFDQMMTA